MLDPATRIRAVVTREGEDSERGAALILVIIITVLLYAIIWQLVREGQTARIRVEGDMLEARMFSQMKYTLTQVEEVLRDDLEAASASDDAEGGGGGGLDAVLGAGAAAGEGEEESEPEPAAIADGSQDLWFEPRGYPDDDLTVYVFVEDEQRKFNILSLLSEDQEFADVSRERFVRLLDVLREDTDFDITASDAETIADEFIDWSRSRSRGEALPRPPLKSDTDDGPNTDVTIPLQLDELLLLRGIDEELFYDKVWEDRVHLGLESVLTIYTSMAYFPGDPDDPNQQAPADDDGTAPAPSVGDDGELVAIGEGPRINLNTAPWPVLRCLFDRSQIPDEVIEAIIEWRNEEEEGSDELIESEYTEFVQEGQGPPRQMFTELEQLEELPEFANLPDPAVKSEFQSMLTLNSDVFMIHLAAVSIRDEESRTYVMQRARSVVLRADEDDGAVIRPIIGWERRYGLRLQPIDIQSNDLLDQSARNQEFDAFSQEERAWNPFLFDFYRPQDEREELYDYFDYR
ncbi:MAG: hypothetical protein AAF196_04110 [Planctomycetota bacterium]